jgi:metal-sulfur cluster biosynthetic enzyme
VAPATEDALSSQSSVRDVLGALSTIIDPDFGTDIVSCGFVKDLSIDNDSSQVQKTCAYFCNLFFCTVSPLQ